jgi:hypothetical protein
VAIGAMITCVSQISDTQVIMAPIATILAGIEKHVTSR